MGGSIRFYIVLLALFMSGVVYAQSFELKEALALENYAMGNATTGMATGIGDMYTNPAGLAMINRDTFSTSYGHYMDGAYNGYTVSYARPLTRSLSIGFSLPVMEVPDIPETVAQSGQGVRIGAGVDRQLSGIVSLGWQALSRLKLGSSINYYRHSLFGETLARWSADVGAIFETDWLSVGLAAHNIGADQNEWSTGLVEDAETWINAGVSTKPIYGTTITADTKMLKHENNQYSAGFSTQLTDSFAIQGGLYDFSEDPSVRLGTTLSVGDLVFHYAYGVSEELGATQKFGFTMFY